MTIAQTLLTSGASDVDDTSYVTGSISPTANRLVLAFVTSEKATGVTVPTASGASMTWTQVTNIPFANNATPTRYLTVFRSLNASPGSGAVTFDYGGNTQIGCMWVIAEFSDVDTGGTNGANAVVQSATNFSDTTVLGLTTTLGAFSHANNATVGAIFKNSTSTIAAGSGFTEIAQNTQTTAALSMSTEFRADNDTSVDFSWVGGNAKCGAIALELKQATVAPPAVGFDHLHLTASPFIRMFVESTSSFVNTDVNIGTAAERAKIAGYWEAIHSENGGFTMGNVTKASAGDLTMAARMAALGVYCSEYRNGSYVQQGTQEAGMMESAPATARAIFTYWGGQYGGPRDSSSTSRHTLASALSSGGTSVVIPTVVGGNHNAPNATADNSTDPVYTPNSWPYWQTKTSGGGSTAKSPANAGTWVIKQVTTVPTGTALTRINAALDMDGCVGFGARIPWDLIETSSGVYNDTFLNNLAAIAEAKGKQFKPRFMVGQYTPSFRMGTTMTIDGITCPEPFNGSGTPNATLATGWIALMQHLFTWARAVNAAAGEVIVPMIDAGLSPGFQYSELYFGPDVQALHGDTANVNAGRLVTANEALIAAALDTGCADGSDDMAVGFGLSGHGPIMTDYASLGTKCISERLAEIIRVETGVDDSPRAYMQANGWGPNGREWGQDVSPEAALDAAVWPIKVRAALQDIYPSSARTAAEINTMFGQARNGTGMSPQPGAYYTEIYEPTFVVGAGGDNLADAAALTALQTQMQAHLATYESGSSGTSTSTAACVSWLRVDNEIMRVDAVSYDSGTGNTTCTVTRGIFGTTPVTHAVGAKVYSPVYIGSVSTGDDASLAGNPTQDLASRPLRYAIKISTPDGYNFIGDRIDATFLRTDATNPWQGHNAIHYDVSGGNRYNQADAWGHVVNGWYDPSSVPVTDVIWANAQKAKFQGLRARTGWGTIKFYANGAGQNWTAWQAAGLDAVVDGGYSEQYFLGTSTISDSDVQFTFDAFANNYGNLFWLRPNRAPAEPDIPQHKRYTYGLVLLAYRASANRYMYGGGGFGNIWNTSTNVAIPPPDLYMWNLGTPTANPASVNDAILDTGTANLKKREYTNGLVVVNFTTGALNYALGGNFYDINILDGNGDPTLVSGTVSIPAKDARFFLNEAAVTGEVNTLLGTGIVSSEAFGAGSVAGGGTQTLTGTGIASAETFGSAVVLLGPTQGLVGTGIPTTEAFGAGVLTGGLGGEGGQDPVLAIDVTPSRSRLPRVRHVFTSPSGQDHPIVNDWWAEEVGPGGFDVAGGQIDAAAVRGHPGVYQAGATWQMWTQDEFLLWEGILLDPVISGTIAELAGRGIRYIAERDAGRLVFLNRNYDDWVEWSSEPHSYDDEGSAYSARVGNGRLLFEGEEGATVAANDKTGLTFWAEGCLLNEFTATIKDPLGNGGANQDLDVVAAVGPTGANNDQGATLSFTDDTEETRNITLADADQISLRLKRTAGAGTITSPIRLWLTDVRVRGIAHSDEMSSSEVVRELCDRLGISEAGVEDTGDNIMPLDHKDGTFGDLLDYCSAFSGAIWRIVSDGTGPFMEFGDGALWFTSRLDGPTDLLPVSRFNRVVVTYSTGTAGRKTRTAEAEPADIGVEDPYGETGWRSTYEVGIDQPQHNANLPNRMAQRLLAILVTERYSGSLDRGFLRDANGFDRSAYELRAGDRIEVIDASPDASTRIRVARKRSTATGVRLTLESRIAEVDSFVVRTERLHGVGGLTIQD